MAVKRRRKKRRRSCFGRFIIMLLVLAVVIGAPVLLMRALPDMFNFIMSPGAVEDALSKVMPTHPDDTPIPDDETPIDDDSISQDPTQRPNAPAQGAFRWPGSAKAQAAPPPPKQSDRGQKVTVTPVPAGVKVVYITFDDGPSPNTPRILDTLKEYGVKATFFTIGSMAMEYPDIIKRQYDEDHIIGNHTQSHKYNTIYKDKTAFKKSVRQWEDTMLEIIGRPITNKLFRFPGGSFSKQAKPFRDTAVKLGYTCFDWTVDSRDALWKLAKPEVLMDNIREGSNGLDEVILLLHDAPAKTTSADVLPGAIEYYRDNGYVFGTLDQRLDDEGQVKGYFAG